MGRVRIPFRISGPSLLGYPMAILVHPCGLTPAFLNHFDTLPNPLCHVSAFSSHVLFVCAKGCSIGAKEGGCTREARCRAGKDRASRSRPMSVHNEKGGANASVGS